jgi:hypothetical protein
MNLVPLKQQQCDRTSFFADLELVDRSTGRRLTGRSLDLCRDGMGLFASGFVAAGAHVQIFLRVEEAGRTATVRLSAVVVQSRAEEWGAILGVAFDSPLTPAVQPILCERLDRQAT